MDREALVNTVLRDLRVGWVIHVSDSHACDKMYDLLIKGKVVPEHHPIKTYWRNGGMAPLIL
jgi:hypothetical protein